MPGVAVRSSYEAISALEQPIEPAHRRQWETLNVRFHETLLAADTLADQGIGAEVIDMATLKPLDMDTVLASGARTGRVVIVHEAPLSGGLGAEIAARLAGDGLAYLLAPVERVTGFDIPMPLARREDDYLPGPARILAACQRVLAC